MTTKEPKTATPNEGWSLAMRLAGGSVALASMIGAEKSAVRRYAAGLRVAPPKWAFVLEEVFGIPKHLTRPDMFGEGE